MRSLIGRLLAVALTSCLAAAVLGAGLASGRTAATTSMTIGVTLDTPTLDYQIQAQPSAILYSLPAYDRLVGFSGDHKKIVPYIATSWKQIPQNRPKKVVFQIRKDAKCDGKQLTPIDIVNSFKRFILVRKQIDRLGNLFGPGPYGVHADMKRWTFTFTTQTPNANLLYGIARSGIICPSGLAALQSDPDALKKGQYGGGPYILDSYTPGSQTVWKRRPGWTWGPPGTSWKNLPETLTYRIVIDPTTMANLILTGAIDAGPVSNYADVPRLAGTQSLVHTSALNRAMTSMVFNQQAGKPTLSDKLRQALMMAVDTKTVAGIVTGGHAVVAPSLLTPEMACFDKKVYNLAPKPDLQGARKLLQDDGWSPNSSGVMTKGGQRLALTLITDSTTMGLLGEYLQKQFESLGAEITLVNVPRTQWAARYVAGNFDVGVSSSSNFTNEQGYNLAVFSGPQQPKGSNSGNVGGGDNEYSRAALLAPQRTDCTWWNRFQELTLTKHAELPLFFPIVEVFGNRKWSFPPNLLAPEPMWIKPGPEN